MHQTSLFSDLAGYECNDFCTGTQLILWLDYQIPNTSVALYIYGVVLNVLSFFGVLPVL